MNTAEWTGQIGSEYNKAGMVLRTRRTVGMVGKARTGSKTHALVVQEVVGLEKGKRAEPGTFAAQWVREQTRSNPRPVIYSARGLCNEQGQHVGYEIPGHEITCEKCLTAVSRRIG